MTSEARVATETPARYVTRLCKHFAHKVPATFSDTEGRIEFAMGTGLLAVEPGTLVLRAQAQDAEGLARVEHVLGSHLERFADKETLSIAWAPAAP